MGMDDEIMRLGFMLSPHQELRDNLGKLGPWEGAVRALFADYDNMRTAKIEMYNETMDTAFALCEEDETEGYRPKRGKSELVDRALDVREERDRLRAAVKP
jgi:hypothetical protein